MEGDGEGEVQPVDDLGGHARSPAAGEGRMTDREGIIRESSSKDE
jgi:hypothetical protein